MKRIIILFFIFGLFLGGCAGTQPQKTPDAGEEPLTSAKADEEPATGSKSDLNKLDLSDQGLERIPENVFGQSELQELDVSHNRLTGAIQAEIRHLQSLVVLNAGDNLMTGVPAEIGQLINLQVLDLSNNQLTVLPHELGNLKNLKTLNISGNQYSAPDLEIIEKELPGDVVIIK